MRAGSFVCEYSGHEGDKLVRNMFDQYTLSFDAMRGDGKARAFRMSANLVDSDLPHRVCRTCVKTIEAKYRGAPHVDQGSLL